MHRSARGKDEISIREISSPSDYYRIHRAALRWERRSGASYSRRRVPGGRSRARDDIRRPLAPIPHTRRAYVRRAPGKRDAGTRCSGESGTSGAHVSVQTSDSRPLIVDRATRVDTPPADRSTTSRARKALLRLANRLSHQ